jgi:hypothetical protein
MGRVTRPAAGVRHVALGFALCVALLILALAPARSEAGFRLGLFTSSSGPIQAINGSVVRINVLWSRVAPSRIPDGFQPSDPGDLHYSWSATDAAVRTAAEHHLQVIVSFLDAPAWAQGPGPVKRYVSSGAWDPNPAMFAAFVHAAAVRYSGRYPDPLQSGTTLPRVKYWEPWNEPNIPGYFSAPNPVSAYRTLLNRAYGVLKSVHGDNLVALGGLAPVSSVPGSIPALDFGAQLMCLRAVGAGFRPDRSCRQRTQFDALDVHPYSLAASPTKHAYKRGDVLVADIGRVGALVHAAHHRQIWATEFSWVTNPPNSYLGDSPPNAARYVAYSMYEMWKAGVSLVLWEQLEDVAGNPRDTSQMVGAGLYTASGRPKLTLQAFAFPFVAGVGGGRGFGWGRVPTSRPVTVLIQRSTRGGWPTMARVRTASDGTFYRTFAASGNGIYRARVQAGATSLPYDSKPIPPARLHAF